jgi:Sec-independent protein translocase protein TatA
MDFMGIGSTELMVALVLATLVLGPQRLVKFARRAGKAVRKVQDMTGELTKTLTDAVTEEKESSSSESSDEKKKVPRLQKIADEIKQALTLEEEKPAASSSSPGGEETAPATKSLAKKSDEIGQTLQKMSQEISQALSGKESPSGESPGGTNE